MSVWLKFGLMLLAFVAVVAVIWVLFGPYIVYIWNQALKAFGQ
jgi:hypothetical protein